MNITKSRYFYYAVILLSLLTIAFSIYYQLGGFKEFKVVNTAVVDYTLAGTEFKGRYSDPEIQVLFESAKERVTSGEINGVLSVIDYLDEDLGENEVRLFIGIILSDKVSELPPEYRVRKIKANYTLSVTLDIHPSVRPTKEKIEALIYRAAQEQQLSVQDYFLEKHFPDNSVMIQGFLK